MNFMVFAGMKYYPIGGWSDFKGGYKNIEEALESVANLSSIDWWHVVSADKQIIVKSGKRA